ncbi:type II secretory pathway component PulL [Leifsonia soli]|uniref:Type II secretory pathway component PulL n=2 Tax=Leifsonia soli TaxID=582665 RepID=A0A852SX54_9MICO|nr:hypothetical protein [Leifsonia soli]NYD73285.1 type II secretory pathway component PulL [Leifsonia soli]
MPSSVIRRAGASALGLVAGLTIALALAGCTGSTPQATASHTATPAATSTATPTTAAGLVPGGTAQENLAYFNTVNQATLAANPNAQGRDFIDALVAAGFTKADMQVTVDTTTIGLKANSIQFSVRMGDSCLIGQNGADAGGYSSMVTPVLSTGSCLIGQTRPIDW